MSGQAKSLLEKALASCSIKVILYIVPRKIREIIKDLKHAGFVDRGGKGNHRNFIHSKGVIMTISGKPGDDAKHYQEKQLKEALERVSK